ncbi:two-component system, response regulator YesN [Paenibacillus sp. yr247]|uniref:response regulator n=1 Tax=Paenibacillus sp. yr247 TaxID=1761880 RepID=UPI000885AB57|nr:response regulator [Paenibacillus sp. yr247]SDO24275.1 two-component system, response regulator YesN [Paenibacillus sp. yr247]
MIRLLIVDNEKHIVQGLHDVFQQIGGLELDIICAYSAQEVIQWLPRVKLDIVLSDIRMPGMSGLELQQLINEQWPHCKVIFLSGFNDFDYAQTALRNGGFDYLLKIDGDHKVIDAIKRAASILSKELQREQLIENAKEQFYLSMPVLRKDFLLHLLEGQLASYRTLAQRFEELDIRLNARAPVMLVLGRIDHWNESITSKDQSLLLYAVQNIVEENLIGYSLIFVVYDRSKFVLLIQPKQEGMDGQTSPELIEKTVRFIDGMMENIQDTCKELLKLSLSFVTSRRPYDWEVVPERFINLKSLMTWGLGYGNEMLITDECYELSPDNAVSQNKQYASAVLTPVKALQLHLECGKKSEFFESLQDFIEKNRKESSYYVLSEIYYSISLMFLSYLNRLNLSEIIAPQIDINKLMHLEHHATWDDAVQYLNETAVLLFSWQKIKQEEQKLHIVQRVNNYVETHLGGDLSLTKLAEVVYLNPSYLSRLYKQISGQGLSDYINEVKFNKAKMLLEHSNMKIQEIAHAVGFESKSYFARFIRSKTNLSPQEYRDIQMNKQVNEKR